MFNKHTMQTAWESFTEFSCEVLVKIINTMCLFCLTTSAGFSSLECHLINFDNYQMELFLLWISKKLKTVIKKLWFKKKTANNIFILKAYS